VVGFAAETQNVIDYARAKLTKKGCDLIVANDVGGTGVMGGDSNTVHLVTGAGVETWPTLAKEEVANRLVDHIAGLVRSSKTAERMVEIPVPPPAAWRRPAAAGL
jgi:phosphopantothenoylcysteine decarboxylase/phosphopantothenate--cysteine ligase